MRSKGFAVARPQIADGQRAVAEPVVRTLKCQDPAASRCEHSRLDGCGDRIGATLTQNHLRLWIGMKASQALKQPDLCIAGIDVTQALHQSTRLQFNRSKNVRMIV